MPRADKARKVESRKSKIGLPVFVPIESMKTDREVNPFPNLEELARLPTAEKRERGRRTAHVLNSTTKMLRTYDDDLNTSSVVSGHEVDSEMPDPVFEQEIEEEP